MLDLDPLKVISTYGYRFKIEVSFKQALNTLGIYAYHFWMKTMTPLKRESGNQHLHKKSDKYRYQVKRKIRAYHCYVQIGCIAQGLLMHLSVNFGPTVWKSFRSCFRTMKKDSSPLGNGCLLCIAFKPSSISHGQKQNASPKEIHHRQCRPIYNA